MMIKCIRCCKSGLLLEMVMDASGRGMSCRTCAGLPPKREVATAKKSPIAPTTTATPSRAREMFTRPKSPQSSRGKYACGNCKYRFSTGKSADQAACPYCGRRRIQTMDEVSADALLRDATRKEFEY